MVLFYFFVLFLQCKAQIFTNEDYPNDYQTYPSNKVPDVIDSESYQAVQLQNETVISLKCPVPGCKRHHHFLNWDYKPCKVDLKSKPWHKFHEDNTYEKWKSLEHHKSRKCVHQYDIKDISSSTIGIYRCRIDGKTVKTFEVEITGSINTKCIEEPPEILDLSPSNSSVPVNTQVVIQCKVYSQHPPAIWWFKQSDGVTYDIKYAEKYYSRINTSMQAYPVPNEKHVYLSKLNIQNVSLIDGGVYVCVGITEQGINLRNAVIRVLTDIAWEPRMSFSLLFLIPLAFALVPITIWLCYYRNKKRVGEEINTHHQQKKLINGRMPVVKHGLFSTKVVTRQKIGNKVPIHHQSI